MKSIKTKYWLLALGFGVMASVPFLIKGAGIVSLVAFLPLLALDRIMREDGARHQWLYIYASFLFFNIFSTFWVWYATKGGAVAALALNALQMALVFAVYRWGRRIISSRIKSELATDALSYFVLLAVWLAWEHLYFESECSWTWLVLGNSLATSPSLAQWYDIFGTVGGSCWILLCNILISLVMSRLRDDCHIAEKLALAAAAVIMVIVPVICSERKYASYEETGKSIEVLVLQPNINPYAKYDKASQIDRDASLMALMESSISDSTAYVIAPETFTFNLDIDNPETNRSFSAFRDALSSHPGVTLLVGAQAYRLYRAAERPTPCARELSDGVWADIYNAAISMDGEQVYEYYFKSKLVPGVEIIPYQKYLQFMTPVFQLFGGISSSYGVSDHMRALKGADGNMFGAMICYESIFGDYSRNAVAEGAGFMTTITNDGWWGDTPGYRQHYRFSSLRAIETRRDVVQSANNGTSGIIDQKGRSLVSTDYWVETTLKCSVHLNDAITPFVRYGDLTGRIACWISLAIFLLLAAASIADRRSSRGISA